ncbi:PhnA-like protein [Microvirga splendida]|nr:PhnA-like protein [Microvirga splendida]
MSPVTPAEDARTIMLNRISWGAVLAGVVTALVTQLILNMIGIGIGVATLDPAAGDTPQASTFSIAAGIWWTLSGIIASFAGGYLAGRLSGRPKESTAGFHGLVSWAATTLLIFYLLTSTLGNLLGGAYNTLSNAVGGLGQAAVQTAAPALAQNPNPFAAIEQQVRSATGGNDPAQLRDAAVASLRAMLTGDQAQVQQARDRAVDALARARNIPPEEARNQVAQYEQQYRQAVDQAKQAADTAATGVSTAALLGALGLILGALAGWFGGRSGAVDPTITARYLAGERR